MDCALSPDFFATIFPQKAQELQLCRLQVFIANTRADEERTRADEANIRADEERTRADEANIRADEANIRANEANIRADEERTRADALERILCEKTRESVYETLADRRWFEEIPQEVTLALDNITSYARLDEVLSAANKAKNYGVFLKALKKTKL